MIGFELLLSCLAINIYHEARGDGLASQQLVAFTSLNRMKATNGDMCEVVFAPYQFSWTIGARDASGKLLPSKLPKDNPSWTRAKNVAILVASGEVKDFTNGATHYHSDSIEPSWASCYLHEGKAGSHYYYNNIRE